MTRREPGLTQGNDAAAITDVRRSPAERSSVAAMLEQDGIGRRSFLKLPSDVVLVGIQVDTTGVGIGLSPPVELAVPAAVRSVKAWCAKFHRRRTATSSPHRP